MIKSSPALTLLVDGLRAIGIEIEFADLGEHAGRLRRHLGRYVLSLDMLCDDEQLCRIMRETLAALTFGEAAATSAVPARPALRLVG